MPPAPDTMAHLAADPANVPLRPLRRVAQRAYVALRTAARAAISAAAATVAATTHTALSWNPTQWWRRAAGGAYQRAANDDDDADDDAAMTAHSACSTTPVASVSTQHVQSLSSTKTGHRLFKVTPEFYSGAGTNIAHSAAAHVPGGTAAPGPPLGGEAGVPHHPAGWGPARTPARCTPAVQALRPNPPWLDPHACSGERQMALPGSVDTSAISS